MSDVSRPDEDPTQFAASDHTDEIRKVPEQVRVGVDGQPSAAPPASALAQPIAAEPARGRSMWPIVALVLGILVVLAVVGVVLTLVLTSDNTASTSTTTPTTTTAAPTTTAPPTVIFAPAPAAPLTQVPGAAPGALASGLYCRDLRAAGYSYAQAVDYWVSEGSPNRMDADVNGIPCETVYPAGDVQAYWGVAPTPIGLASGLFCQDLANMGYAYWQAVDYWWSEGAPSRMDADNDGYPCETVYSANDLIAYWGFLP